MTEKQVKILVQRYCDLEKKVELTENEDNPAAAKKTNDELCELYVLIKETLSGELIKSRKKFLQQDVLKSLLNTEQLIEREEVIKYREAKKQNIRLHQFEAAALSRDHERAAIQKFHHSMNVSHIGAQIKHSKESFFMDYFILGEIYDYTNDQKCIIENSQLNNYYIQLYFQDLVFQYGLVNLADYKEKREGLIEKLEKNMGI